MGIKMEEGASENGFYKKIEPGIRPLVKLLRDNGWNTICSCEHDMTVECEGVPLTNDGPFNDLDMLLFNAGYRDYIIFALKCRSSGIVANEHFMVILDDKDWRVKIVRERDGKEY